MKTLISHSFLSDGGHGWLKVSKDRLSKLNLLDKISPYSYMRGNFVYLEEDCDLSLYVDTLLKLDKIERDTEDYNVFMRNLIRDPAVGERLGYFFRGKFLCCPCRQYRHPFGIHA